ncbi:MAG TPA: DUF5103 domain-containing protein [Chitinophagaceae bacterium]|nr:DUF5103 domain-containing protein [Chitinophagaceae bacterium]
MVLKTCMVMRILLLFLLVSSRSFAQIPEKVYLPQIKSPQLHLYGNQVAYPIMKLNGGDRLELHFDDLDANVKNYSYTFQLCNADWTPAMLSQFDYIRGFSQQRISTYRVSTLAYTRYTHYQAVLPDRNCMPSRSGNYILKVFLDGDTSKLAFTKRMLVYEDKAIIAAQVQQPFNTQIFRTHQKINFKVNTKNLGVVNPLQQVYVAILQNDRWDNAVRGIRPTFMTNNQLEYNTEDDAVFASGKEWRWLDLRSFRLQSDRVQSAKYSTSATEIIIRPDVSRRSYQFSFYRDVNGHYYLEPSESINPYWQSDYATVRFSFVPPGNIPFPDKEVFLFGQFTNYGADEGALMQFNTEKGVYETAVFLKQGYYDFSYVTRDKNGRNRNFSFDDTEGNYWETENEYTILVYYRPLGGRADELVGLTKINSLTGRPGF